MVFENQVNFAGIGKLKDSMEINPIAILKIISSQIHSLNIFAIEKECIRFACCIFGCF